MAGPKLATASITALILAAGLASQALAQSAPPRGTPPDPNTAKAPSYVIGPGDVLGVVFWREPDISGDVTVRPDGKITLPVIGEIPAAGVEPEQLRDRIAEAAAKYLTDVNVQVVVRTINSRTVYVTGRVTTPGTYPLTGPLTVMQAIALAGGLTEYADGKNITILRNTAGGPENLKFNYKDVSRGKSLEQNVRLQPGDTIVVP